jgi:phage gpG-like protein
VSGVLNIELEEQQLLRAIDQLLATLEQPRELLEQIGSTLEMNAQLRFDSKTDPSGQPWAPLSPATKAIYESDWFIERNPEFKGGIPGSLLQRTNRLRQSLAYNVGPDWLELGTSRKTSGKGWQVGLLHEWGTANMPRRGLLVADPATGRLGAEDQADVLAIVTGMLGDALR